VFWDTLSSLLIQTNQETHPLVSPAYLLEEVINHKSGV